MGAGLPWLDVAAGRTFFAHGEDGVDPELGQDIYILAGLVDGHGTRIASVICDHDPDIAGHLPEHCPQSALVPLRIANLVLRTHAQRELAQALPARSAHAAGATPTRLGVGQTDPNTLWIIIRISDNSG